MEARTAIISLILVLYVLVCEVYSASALQDANITLSDMNSGLCISVDMLSNVRCDNETLQIEGTQDHVLYILPGEYDEANINATSKVDKYVIEPISVILILGIPILGGILFYVLLSRVIKAI